MPNKIETNADKKFLVYINSNCIKEREELFALIKAKQHSAEALGKCSNTQNGKQAQGGWMDVQDVLAQYKFAFAMENERYPGYITEKILNAFQAGTIPIYWGDSKTVEKFFNPKAYIDVSKFKSLEDAANYIVDLNNNLDKVRAMQQEPMFKDNKMHELFLSDKNSPYVVKYGEILRDKYYDFLRHKKVIKP
jgi:hypothetical protein